MSFPLTLITLKLVSKKKIQTFLLLLFFMILCPFHTLTNTSLPRTLLSTTVILFYLPSFPSHRKVFQSTPENTNKNKGAKGNSVLTKKKKTLLEPRFIILRIPLFRFSSPSKTMKSRHNQEFPRRATRGLPHSRHPPLSLRLATPSSGPRCY